MTGLPFEGVTVLSLEQAVAAPFATRQLADLGARVIKIERPGAADFARGYDRTVRGQSSYFVWLNRSKESLSLDLKSPGGLAILGELLAESDVLVQNLAPGAATRMGLDTDSLAARFPKLIYCQISGFGSDGPWADRKAYDLLVQAECGLVSITGTPADIAKTAISIADIAAGMYAFTGIQTALYTRAITGRAPTVSVSLFDALAEWMGSPAYYTMYGGSAPERVGAQHATIAPYGPYTASDGTSLLIAIQNDREWTRFCAVVLGAPALATLAEYATNSDRVAHRDELNAVITKRFSEFGAPELVGMLEQSQVAYASLNTMRQFLDHPVLRERDRWRSVDTPAGPIEALLPPATIGGFQPQMGPVPALGEHTEQILRGLGRDAEEIDRLKASNVI
jgi:crotonobetainyl-CoA:carnitine CoA-transferase CaiB-like acyl-CoA transferase